jgi:hypothetical protein
MKQILLLSLFTAMLSPVFAQKVDSIFFHLYTDSLKKGQYNYINVDGKLSNGKWQPMTANDLIFSSSAGNFHGNELVIPEIFAPEKVTVKAILKNNPSIWKEVTIWIKRLPDPPLPTKDEVINSEKRKNRRS